MQTPVDAILENMFLRQPEETTPVETAHRKITTSLPAPETLGILADSARLFPQVNCYQPPIVWDTAEGYQVFDGAGNCWIDFTSTAVMANSGHGHPEIRRALGEHLEAGLLAQFSFASDIRNKLAERLLQLSPPGCEKVYFWTVGSEAVECSLRLAREWGMRHHPGKCQILTFAGDYHGWTLGAHQLSGESAQKPWLASSDANIHHLPYPGQTSDSSETDDKNWDAFFDQSLADLKQAGVSAGDVAAIFIETFQGWGALQLPGEYIQRLRNWADDNDVLLIFDEIQTGFGRTGKWFAHEHYGVRADLICIGKGLTSSLPLAAVLGPAEILDLLPPGEVTSTHAAHPVSCAAALANLDVLDSENLIAESARKGEIARSELRKLQARFPEQISHVSGLGLLNAVHLADLPGRRSGKELARDWTWECVKRGVMVFYTNRATLKVCPPLVIPDEALIEGITVIGDVFEQVLEAVSKPLGGVPGVE